MIPKHIIDEIMSTARIEEVIGDFVSLKKSGSGLKALSPFSQEKTPSFYVSPNKQIFKDFSSNKGGNVVTFIMEHEQMSYPEALRYLAKRYNIAIPEEKELSSEEILKANERESLYIVLQYAADFFRKQLLESEDGQAIGWTYFKERGFSEATLEKFVLGFSPTQWDALSSEALKLGYKAELLELAGLSKVNEKGNRFDMFRNRVIFPIHNLSGKIVAFAGRQLSKDDKGPKYLNSPETPVYHKSDVLYGMFFAKNSIRMKDKCYLVEGYTDVITLYQNGIENVVASSGTSLTEGQIRQVNRFTPNITVLYDGDPAGLRASQRGIDLILAQGLNVRLVVFPEGEDPDSYCKKVGGQQFQEYIDREEKDFILFKSQLLLDETGNDPLKKVEAIKSIVASIALIPDPVKRSVFAQSCAKIMDVAEQVIAAELIKYRRKDLEERSKHPDVIPIEEQLIPDDAFEPLGTTTSSQEREILSLLVRHGHEEYDAHRTVLQFVLGEIQAEIGFTDPFYSMLYQEVMEKAKEGETMDTSFYVNHPQKEVNAFAADALHPKYRASEKWTDKYEIELTHTEDNYRQDIFNAVLHYKIRKIEMLMEERMKNLKNLREDEEIMIQQETIVALQKLREQLTGMIGITVIK